MSESDEVNFKSAFYDAAIGFLSTGVKTRPDREKNRHNTANRAAFAPAMKFAVQAELISRQDLTREWKIPSKQVDRGCRGLSVLNVPRETKIRFLHAMLEKGGFEIPTFEAA